MPKKLLLLCSRGFPGSYKVITNLNGVLNGIIDSQVMSIEDLYVFRPPIGNMRVKRRLQKIQTDVGLLNVGKITDYGDNILFTAWGPPYDVLLTRLNKVGITPSLIMCSTPGQSELSRHELKDYHKLFEYFQQGKLKYWLLNKRLFDALADITKHAVYFPHTIDLNQFKDIAPLQLEGINIDLFCTTRLGKNILNQVLAFKISETDGVLHVNFKDNQVSLVMNDITKKIVYHDWIPDSQYYSLVAAMDLSLQATFTESFNYAVAERMCLGIPVITSYDIYLTALDSFLSEYLCVRALDTPSEIAGMMKRVVKDQALRRALSERCRTVIKQIAVKNNKEAVDYITGFLK
jgi:glycosyltransferase involved in cell wall biosynthesis